MLKVANTAIALDVASDAIPSRSRIATVDRPADLPTEPGTPSADHVSRRTGRYFGLVAVVGGLALTVVWIGFLAWCAFRLLAAILF